MKRIALGLLASVLLAGSALGHFIFAVPAADGKSVVAVFSEDLDADENIPVKLFQGLQLSTFTPDGKTAKLEAKAGEHSLTAGLTGDGPKIVFGSFKYGVQQKGDAKAFLLVYHPKAVLGGLEGDKATLGEKHVAAELVPVVAGSEWKFKFVSAGKPVADAELNVIKPDGGKAKVKTDKDGLSPGFPAKGRYGVWGKVVKADAGTHDGKAYAEARHYATLVVGTK